MTDLIFFFFTYSVTPEIYTLSLHDALPISAIEIITVSYNGSTYVSQKSFYDPDANRRSNNGFTPASDRKSTRLNSSHLGISYAVFCLKKKINLHQSA